MSVRLDNPAGNFLRIQVNVRNFTDAPLRFRYHIEWFNKDGRPLPLAGEAYISWMLLPREESTIAATSPTPTAADFGIMFVPAVD